MFNVRRLKEIKMASTIFRPNKIFDNLNYKILITIFKILDRCSIHYISLFIGGQKVCNAKVKYKQHVGNKCFKKTHFKDQKC